MVDIATVTDFDCEHDQFFVSDLAEHAVITDAISPFSRMIARQSFSSRARVVAVVNIFYEPRNYDPACSGIHFGKLPVGSLGKP